MRVGITALCTYCRTEVYLPSLPMDCPNCKVRLNRILPPEPGSIVYEEDQRFLRQLDRIIKAMESE